MKMRFVGSVVLASLSGALIATAGPPTQWTWNAFFAAPTLLVALELACTAPRRRGVLRGFGLGLVAGAVCNMLALAWVPELLEGFGGFPTAAAFLVGMILWLAQALVFALGAAGASALMRAGAASWLALPACLAVAFSLVPALFPWRPSASQMPFLPWVQAAELGGEPLLDFLLLLPGCAALEAWRARRVRLFALAAVAVLLPWGYGALRLPQIEAERRAAPELLVGVVQPNIGIHAKHDPRLWYQHLAHLHAATQDLEARGAELVVWPETAYPFRWPRDRRLDFTNERAALGTSLHGPLLFGAVTQRSRCERWNSVLAMDRSGVIRGMADKVELLAFGEYVPLWHVLPPLRARFACPGFVPGAAPLVLTLAGARIGTLNCYEDVLARFAWQVTRARPDFLVNVTNDAWFGDTAEPHLHHLVARMRSIETRRDLVRAVNTGVSGHVLSTGEDVVHTKTFEPASFIAHVRLLRSETPWVRFGDWFTPAMIGALLGTVLALRQRMRRAIPTPLEQPSS